MAFRIMGLSRIPGLPEENSQTHPNGTDTEGQNLQRGDMRQADYVLGQYRQPNRSNTGGQNPQDGNTRQADYVLGRNRHPGGGQTRQPDNPALQGGGSQPVQPNNPTLQDEYAALQREHQALQDTCNDYRNQITNLEQQRELDQRQIAEQRSRIEELERDLRSDTGVQNEELQKLREALETVARERDEAVQERDEAVQMQKTAIQERDEAVRMQETAICEKEEILQQLEEMESSLQSYENLETASRHLQDSEEELKRIQMQFDEIEQEKGSALEQLQELNMRYQKDLKYIEFYQKLPTEKIDGLELFRMKLTGLNDELSEILDQGIKKAYVFRSTDLVDKLEEARQKSFEVLGQMRELTENFELPEPEEGIILGEMSTEESRRKAEEALDQYEKTLKQMYDLSEKVLRIKNTIDFSFAS